MTENYNYKPSACPCFLLLPMKVDKKTNIQQLCPQSKNHNTQFEKDVLITIQKATEIDIETHSQPAN